MESEQDPGPPMRAKSAPGLPVRGESAKSEATVDVLARTKRNVDTAVVALRTKQKMEEAANQISEIWGTVHNEAKTGAYWRPTDWLLGTSQGQGLFLLMVASCLISSGIVAWMATGGSTDVADTSFKQSFWISWGLFFDPGTQTGIAADDRWRVKFVAMAFSLAGFIFNLAFLGLIVDVVRTRLARWKQENSRVVARDHILLLGWGDKTLFLLNEILASQAAHGQADELYTRKCCVRRRRSVVVLADKAATEMRQEVRMHFHFQGVDDIRNIKFRRGDPTSRTELMKVSAKRASVILIQSPGGGGLRRADEGVIQTLLAIAALPSDDGNKGVQGEVIAEMQSDEGVNVVNHLLPDAKGIFARQAVNRMLILRALVTYVGFTYLDLVSFQRGNELYMLDVPKELVGYTFLQVCPMFQKSVVVGIRPQTKLSRKPVRHSVECAGGTTSLPTVDPRSQAAVGSFALIPDGDRIMQDTDQLILFSECYKDACYFNTGVGDKGEARKGVPSYVQIDDLWKPDGQLALGKQAANGPKQIAIIGCPHDFPNFLHIMDTYLPTGSVVYILSERPLSERNEAMRRYFGPGFDGEHSCFKHFTVDHRIGPASCKVDLMGLPFGELDCVMILAEHLEKNEDPVAADSRNLTSAITIKTIQEELKAAGKQMKEKCKVLTELLDPKSQQVVDRNDSVRKTGSFLYSNALETGIFAMAAEEQNVFEILMKLMDPHSGAGHICSVPIKNVVQGMEELSFADLHARVWQACGGILLGWKRALDRYPELNPVDKNRPYEWTSTCKHELLVFRPQPESVAPARSTECQTELRMAASAEEVGPETLLPGCVAPILS